MPEIAAPAPTNPPAGRNSVLSFGAPHRGCRAGVGRTRSPGTVPALIWSTKNWDVDAPEIQKVTALMRSMGRQVGCRYNQKTAETPQLYFSHQFKAGDRYALADRCAEGSTCSGDRPVVAMHCAVAYPAGRLAVVGRLALCSAFSRRSNQRWSG